MIKKILRFFYIVYVFTLFVAGLLIIFPVIIIAIFLGQPTGGNLAIKLCRGWSDVWLFLIGIRNKTISQENIDPKKHYVFVANHISYLDIPVIFQAVRKNHIRVLGKIEMSKIPLFGMVYKLAVVLVDRTDSKGRAKSIERLRKVLDQNISIFIFPEGTFNESGQPLKSFYDGAFRMAIETATPIKPIVYLDTVKLMYYSSPFTIKPGVSRMVILPEVPVDGLTMSDVAALKLKVYTMMYDAIVNYR
jgi:1-acyl-sn-glycerol-3-phosphate acyltransferase